MNGKRIFYGGPILTLNEDQPSVEAVAIEGEKIIAVGELAEIKQKMGSEFEFINLDGCTLLPGFIDSHMHPIMFIFFLVNLLIINPPIFDLSFSDINNLLNCYIKIHILYSYITDFT